MKWVVKAIGKHGWAVGLLCVFSAALSFAGVVQSLAMRNFVDQAAAGSLQGFLNWFGVYLTLIFFQLVGGALSGLMSNAVTLSVFNKIRGRCFSSILTRQYASLRGYHSGDYMQRLSNDSSVVASNAVGMLPGIVSMITQLLAAIACLGILQGRLVLVLLVSFVVMLAVAAPLRGIVRKHHIRVMKADGAVKSVLYEALDNLLIIRSFQAVKGVETRAAETMGNYRRVCMRQAAVSQVIHSGSSVALNVVYIIGLVWCGLGMVRGSISYGTFSAVWQLIGQITGPAMSVAGIVPQYAVMMASVERLQELDNLEPEKLNPDTDWQKVKEEFTQISCNKLTFSYETKGPDQNAILHDLDFTIHRGDVIAITGESGIGKSTFLKLLLGIYSATEDSIAVCDREGRKTVLDAGARTMISYVPQGNFLMSGTIREAIHFWQQGDVDEEQMREACRIAEAEDFILNLEKGFDTELGERGAGLSEGQLQRLAIARAIYSGKPVLLLDEATSALDEQTEAKVLENLKELKNRTVIIVTHRKAALDICNRIVEMDNGRIREHGVDQ